VDPLLLLPLANVALTVVLIAVVILARRPSSSAAAALDAVVRGELRLTADELRGDLGRQRLELGEQLTGYRRESQAQLDAVRDLVGERLQTALAASVRNTSDRLDALARGNAEKHIELQALLRDELEKLRRGNEAELERMRATVDEKLQGTLERRLGESFGLVSARLEEVQRGLGEMQSLASDVGGLKRVLTNVKSRGGWGEVQLARQLEDVLTRDQYGENVAVRPGSAERVEFAIRMPGRGDGRAVHLAVDSKLPQEDYDRLLDAQERGDRAAVDEAGRRLERAIVEQAKSISGKYIEPPHTTDFAIMYLPTEGLFAEVVRRPGLASRLQTDHRVLVTGPTTFAAILGSLQTGFRTLAIEKRSSEVWEVLSAAKTEFRKYGDVWQKLGKQLEAAQNTVQAAGVRTRAVERRLRDVETPPEAARPDDPALDSVAGRSAELHALDPLGATRSELDLRLIEPAVDDGAEAGEPRRA